MSNEYRKLHERYNTVNGRLSKIREAQAVLDSVAVDAEAELRKLKLEMDALRYEGDTEFNEKVGKK